MVDLRPRDTGFESNHHPNPCGTGGADHQHDCFGDFHQPKIEKAE